jgi:hypothetical protein
MWQGGDCVREKEEEADGSDLCVLQLVLSSTDRADAGLAVVSLAWSLLSWYRSCEGKLREVAGECHLFMARDVPYCEAVKRACLPRATHCLCRAMAPAGVTEGASCCVYWSSPSSDTGTGRSCMRGGANRGVPSGYTTCSSASPGGNRMRDDAVPGQL